MTSYARRGDLAGPVLLIGFGLLLFLINTGQVALTLWEALARLWPLALVAMGIDLLVPRRSVIGSVGTAALILAVVGIGSWIALGGSATAAPAAGEPVAVAATGETQAAVQLVPAAGRLDVRAMAAPTSLLAGSIEVSPPASVATTSRTEGGVTHVAIRTTGSVGVPINWGWTERWDIELSGVPTISLSTDMGAGDTVIDARGLHLGSYNGSTGVGRIEVYLPEGATRVDLSTGIGEIVIHVPAGVPVRLRGSWALGGIHLPPGYYKVNDRYLSPGFEEAEHIELNASLAIGAVTIQEY